MRARSLLLSALGLIGGAATWLLLLFLLPIGRLYADIASRLALGAASLLPAAAVLAAMILAQIALRFATMAFDPTAGRDGRPLVVNQRVIANTVEQMLCFVPAVLALAAAIGPLRMPMVVAAGLTFALARLAFWAGYLASPMLRAPGMAATGLVTFGTLLGAVWFWLP
jgi:hypothetical protein